MANIVKIKVIDENGQKLNNLSVGDKIKANINNNYYTFNPTDSTITLKNDIVNNNLFIKEVGFDSEYVKYWCSYIYRPDMWSYSINNINGGNVPYQENTDIIIQFLPKDWKSCPVVTLKPSLTIPNDYITSTVTPPVEKKIKITYITYNNDIPITNQGLQNYILDDNGTKTIDLGPNFWTGFSGLTNIDDIPMLEANITYWKPFRITNDVSGNDKITETIKNTDLTYTANLQFEVKDPTVAYYTKESQIQMYFITKPYIYYTYIGNKQKGLNGDLNIDEFSIKYKDNDTVDSKIQKVTRVGNNDYFSYIVLNSTLTKNFVLNIYDVFYRYESYFCPYLIHNDVYHFSYTDVLNHSFGEYKLDGTTSSATGMHFKFYHTQDTTVIPKLQINPIGIPNNLITLKYNKIDDNGIINRNNYYQYSTVIPSKSITGSETTLDKWAKYGFNVEGMPYKIELDCNKQNSFTQDIDLYHIKDNNRYICSVDKKEIEDTKHYIYTIKPLKEYDFKYFHGTVTPLFEIFPRTHIEYELDDNIINNKYYLTLNLDFGSNKTESEDINVHNYKSKYNANCFEDVKQTVQLKSNNGETQKEIKKITISRIEYNSDGTTQTTQTIVNTPSIGDKIINNSVIRVPNTWKETSVKYKFDVEMSEEPPAPPSKKEQFGLTIYTEDVKRELEYILNITDSSFKFTGGNSPEISNNISANGKNYKGTIDNISNNTLFINSSNDLLFTPDKLNFNLYLSNTTNNTSYCVPKTNFSLNFNTNINNTKYDKISSLYLRDYIEENNFYRGKNQIKLSKIDVPYEINMSIMDTTNNTTLPPITKKVNETDSTFDIEDKYSDDKKYSLVVNNIKATIGGNPVELPRYNFNLVDGSIKVSYIKNPPITFTNGIVNDVTMSSIRTIDGTLINDEIILPAEIEDSNIYFNTYIASVKLNSIQAMKVVAKYNGGSLAPLPGKEVEIVLSSERFIEQLTISNPT